MALPKAVQAQLDHAAEIEAQLAGGSESQTGPATNEAPPAEPVAPVAPQPPAEPTPGPDWEQKYRTIQAKYDAEVPRYAAEVRELKHQVQQLHSDVEAQKKAAPAPQEKPAAPLVTEQDKEAFGEDLVNLQERIARAVAAPYEAQIQKLEARLAKFEGTVDATNRQQAQTAEDRYFEKLTSTIPQWQQINADPKWVEWLTGRYPGMSQTRQQQLDVARAALDVVTTAEMFNAYQELTAPQKQTNQSQALNSQVAPSTSRASTAPTQTSEKRIWTPAEISAALDPRTLKGMKAEEIERVMSEIDAAAAEGRIRT